MDNILKLFTLLKTCDDEEKQTGPTYLDMLNKIEIHQTTNHSLKMTNHGAHSFEDILQAYFAQANRPATLITSSLKSTGKTNQIKTDQLGNRISVVERSAT